MVKQTIGRTFEEIEAEDKKRIASLVEAARLDKIDKQNQWATASTETRLQMLPGLLEVQAGNPSYYNALQVAICNNLKAKYPPKKQYYGVKTSKPNPEPEQAGQIAPDNRGDTERTRPAMDNKTTPADTGKTKGGPPIQGLLF